MVEAGDDNLDSNPLNVIDISSGNIAGELKFGFSQQIGGSSNLWAGGLAKMDSIDLIGRHEFNSGDWPVGQDELESLYKRVDRHVGINQSTGDQCPEWRDFDVLKHTILNPRRMVVLNTPYSTSVLVSDNENIQLFKKCSATRVRLSDDNTSITKIEVYDQEQKRNIFISAKVYILAAGTLTNVRILLHSLRRIRDSIPNLYNNIGRYFSTHPKGNVGVIRLDKPLASDHFLFSVRKHSTYSSRLQFGLTEKALIENQLLNHCLRFDSPFNHRATRIFDYIKNLLGSLPITRSGKGALVETLANLGVSVYKVIDNIGTSGRSGKTLAVRAYFDQSASAENRIQLSDRKSQSGLPLAAIDWRFNEDDWGNAEKFLSIFSDQLRANDLGEFLYKRPGPGEFTAIHSHFMGGTRIGSTSDDSVVDNNLNVHGIRNLYVSGPSVFPSHGYANPFYTIAAFSLRLSDHIYAKYGVSTNRS